MQRSEEGSLVTGGATYKYSEMKIRQKSYEKMMLMMMVLKETVIGCKKNKGSSAATSPAILRNSE
jgi:hypothetical protein